MIIDAVRIVLVSTYELGRQPFGLASPAAWLRREGHEVTCADLSRAQLPRAEVADADLVCFFLPMHTATRLFLKAAPVERANLGRGLEEEARRGVPMASTRR